MRPTPMLPAGPAGYEIRFQSLFDAGRGVTFPCDAQGRVLWERLSDRARQAYERARELVGREYATPAVQLSDAC